MERHELHELHYLTPIVNVASILNRGILSHRRAARFDPPSIAAPEIQARRAHKRVPVPGKVRGRLLHDYVNLYICAKNPMLYKRRGAHAEICVLRVDTAVLDLDGVIITDQNAASDYVRFHAAPDGLRYVNRERTFADDWRHPDDAREYYRHSSQKCAEVLVPNRVAPDFVFGVYVSCNSAQATLNEHCPELTSTISPQFFFQ